MLGLATTATAVDSLLPEQDGASSTAMDSMLMSLDSVSGESVSVLSRCCGLSPKLASYVPLLSTSVLPAVATLCIVRVPNVGSRLQRLSIVALCMLLLCAATYCTASQQTQGASTTDMLSSSSSSAAGMQMPPTYSASSSSSTGTLISMTGAALPILLALFMVQAPAAIPQGRRSQAGLAAVLSLSIMLQLVTVDAAASVCASIKPMCTGPRPIVMVANVPKSTATKSWGAAPSKLSSSSSSSSSSVNPLAAMGLRKEALHVALLRAPESAVPQRVFPDTPHMRLSKAREQQLFTQLLVALASNSSRSSTSPAVPRTFRPAMPVSTPVSPACTMMSTRLVKCIANLGGWV
ncbi:hypothetical protein COO60DRAFT_1024194 [Scenedesmus sp. NREL 46B-D3]|nr:hypothetical protein COO60DRAFT_1024194 [Scenedesmus sp. NREL 46B-D3]